MRYLMTKIRTVKQSHSNKWTTSWYMLRATDINNGKFMRASHSGGKTGKMEKRSELFNTSRAICNMVFFPFFIRF
jgi:hypothetical protein